MRSFSATTRADDLRDATSETYDLIIIGGGINGAGVLRDASLRGLKVLLLEKYDYASGTSSKSSKLIHGGLRYLKQAAIRLTHESCMERNRLVKQNPHLIQPIPFLYPIYKGDKQGPFILRMGMLAYEILSLFQNHKMFRMFSKDQCLEEAPDLRAEGLLGGAFYYDATVDDARLVIETLKAGIRAGGKAFNRMTVCKTLKAEGRIIGVAATDGLTGETHEFKGSVVLNATGSWVDSVRKMDGKESQLLSPTKGVHIMIARDRFQQKSTVAFPSLEDRRMMFAIPWGDVTVVGTTDTHYDGDKDFITTKAPDVDYILESTNHFFPEINLTHDDVEATYAGLRPLIANDKTQDPGRIPREHQIFIDDTGLISIAGGKLTTYRLICRELVDKILKQMPAERRKAAGKCQTNQPITGAVVDVDAAIHALVEENGFSEAVAKHLVCTYGPGVDDILQLSEEMEGGRDLLHPDHRYIRAEVAYAVYFEGAVDVADVLTRRIRAAIWRVGQGLDLAEPVSQIMAQILNWSDEKRVADVSAYAKTVREHHQSHPDTPSGPVLVEQAAPTQKSKENPVDYVGAAAL